MVHNVKNKLSEKGLGIEFAKFRLLEALSKNSGLFQIRTISGIISEEINKDNEDIVELSYKGISCFKYAPITSTDVEIGDNRTSIYGTFIESFQFCHLKTHLVTLCWYLFQNNNKFCAIYTFII